ncbi:MAG: OmpA family protein [Bacteroidales bacterium]|jgi:chemotaxis protein MotB|nr:OmpA family protein [Bacteroidales bacterium]
MKRNLIPVIASVLVSLLAISCVPGKKYKTLQDTSRQYMDERDQFKTDNISLEMANRELEARMAVLEKQVGTIKEDIAKAQGERDKAVDEFNRISSKYTELQNAQEDLVRGNVKETQALIAELQSAQKSLQEKEDIMRQLEQTLDSKKSSLDELTFELEKRNARLVELQKILDAQKKIAQDLKNKVSEALLGFENNGLTVTNKNGKVYVSLDEKLLFKSASWDIDANGKAALKKLAGVLEKNPDIQITIEGHTDDVPYKPTASELKDNWDLSVKRATTVVRVLLEGSKIDPERLTAAGHSEYMPVDSRTTADARQKNRRTEIVLTPDLTELYKLINKY